MWIRILGCGASTGVPYIGCQCKVCKDNRIRNKRRRSSIMLGFDNNVFVVDTGPDFRQQILDSEISRIDGVIYTHAHSDHCHGIEDVRTMIMNMNTKSPMKIYSDSRTLGILKNRFEFIFRPPENGYDEYCYLESCTVNDLELFNIFDVNVVPFSQTHGNTYSMGYIFERNGKKFAYSTDTNFIDPDKLDILKRKKLDLWIIGCVGYNKSFSHATLDEVLSWQEIVRPKSIVITHMSHKVDYYDHLFPDDITIAYDGMMIDI